MKIVLPFFLFFFPFIVTSQYNQSAEIEAQQKHENPRMRFKLLQSKVAAYEPWAIFNKELEAFSETRYRQLAPLILEQDILTLQKQVNSRKFSYEELVLFYLYRIKKYESNPETALYTIISLNPDALKLAREKDRQLRNKKRKSTIFGMPILLKDNIGFAGLPTTAGAVALADNFTKDAFIVKRLKEEGAIILGKVNLSEWAYYFCEGCPLGYSAVGGQTLNPYGRKVFETGGSSSGSGVAVAVNYAVAAVGTETAGSILSPSSQNSVVGLKPTVGLLSRTGIVPISSTLDTPGPMTRNVIDNAILLQAMLGKDTSDGASVVSKENFTEKLSTATLKGKRLGVMKGLMERDSMYKKTAETLKSLGAEVIEYDAPQAPLNYFLTLLNADMKKDLPKYLSSFANKKVKIKSVADVIAFNLKDTLVRRPYNQKIFETVAADTTSEARLDAIKTELQTNGRTFFDVPLGEYKLDAVLSINNYHAAQAAVAKYPAITVPMGYKTTGEPISLTFITKPFKEADLLQLAFAFEQATKIRKPAPMYAE